MSDIVGTDGDDTLVGTSGDDVMEGGLGRDRLNGGAGDDIVKGGDGNDYVYGDAGNDQLFGGTGNDTLVGDAGDDLIYGEEGNDGVFGGGGNDTIFGGVGVDTIYGDGGNDFIDGGDDNDNLFGGSGNDTIFGGAGDDKLDGGTGNDTLIYESGTGSDYLAGGSGMDTVELRITSADLTQVRGELGAFSEWLEARVVAVGGDFNGLGSQTTSDGFTFQSLGITVSAVEHLNLFVDGVAVDWTGLLNSAPEVADAQTVTVDEDQTVSGLVGATDADGDALTHEVATGPVNGTVTIDAETGEFVYTPASNFSGSDSFVVTVTDAAGETVTQVVNVTVNAVADAPELNVGNTTVTIGGGTVTGTSGNDVLYGTEGSDLIVGGDGDDILYSEANGNVSYDVALDIRAALVDLDGSETLTVQISGVPDGASLSSGEEVSAGVWRVNVADLSGLTMHVTSPVDVTLTVSAIAAEQNGSTSSTSAEINISFESVDGVQGIHAEGGVDILRGGAGNDIMIGGSGTDFIDYSTTDNGVTVYMSSGRAYGDGFDRFSGIEGVIGSDYSDQIYGDSGDNIIMSGDGNDWVSSGSGNDTIHDGNGADSIDAGSGNDVIVAAEDGSNDQYDGGSGFDIVDYSAAENAIRVDLNNGQVYGEHGGRDKLWSIEGVIGGAGDDTMVGSRYDDSFDGGAGNDVIQGGRGYDVLTGGEGDDTFVFTRQDVLSGRNYYGFDTITDFGAGDRLDFSGLGSGNHAIDLRYDVQLNETANGTMISVDMGGHTGFVEIAFLDGVHGIDINDLVDAGHFVV